MCLTRLKERLCHRFRASDRGVDFKSVFPGISGAGNADFVPQKHFGCMPEASQSCRFLDPGLRHEVSRLRSLHGEQGILGGLILHCDRHPARRNLFLDPF